MEKVGEIHSGSHFGTKDAVGGCAFLEGALKIVIIRCDVPTCTIERFIVAPKILLRVASHTRGAEELA
jgi:hypothetical protein